MANFPCPNVLTCPPGTNAENQAVRNLTAELPDRFTYFGQFQCAVDASNPAYSVCESVQSQRAADLCAALCLPDDVFLNAEQTCSNGCASVTIPARTMIGVSQQNADELARAYACATLGALCLFGNTPQSCTVQCLDGHFETYTVVASQIFSTSTMLANAQALHIACAAADLQCIGTIVFNEPQSCTVTCPNGALVTYTIPAGVVAGLSVFEANVNAQLEACALGLLACPSLPPLIGNTEQTCTQTCNGLPISYVVPAGAFVAADLATANSTAFLYACRVLSGACQTGQPPPQINVGNEAQSCTINCAGGGTFTSTVPPGTFRSVNRAAANAAAASYACSKANAIQFCLLAIQDSACVGEVYAAFVSTAGPASGIIMTISEGALPSGLTFSQGVIAGIPTVPGNYSFTVFAQDGLGNSAARSYTMAIGGFITSSPLPAGNLSNPYAQTIVVSGFTNPLYTITGGALPTGLTINPSNGLISGTPTSTGTFTFVVTVEST